MPRFLYLKLHLLVVLFATTAIIGNLISISAPALVAWRTALAALGAGLLVVLVLRRKLLPPAGRTPLLLGVGVIVGIHWMCFFGAIKLSNISICLAGMATTSFFTAFTEPWIERRRIRPLEVGLGVLVLAGIVTVAGFERGHLAGLGVALLGALLAALFPVLNRHLVGQGALDPLVMVAWEMVGACLACLVGIGLLDGPGAYAGMFRATAGDWLWIVLLALVCTVFGHAYHIYLLKYLSAYVANLAINFEPVYGILAAAVLFGEYREMHPGFFIGTGAIVVANFAHPVVLHRIARRKHSES